MINNGYYFKTNQSPNAVFRIRIDLNTDPDPAFKVDTDPDPAPDSDPGIFMTKMKENFFAPKN